jgi:hypothetical protein
VLPNMQADAAALVDPSPHWRISAHFSRRVGCNVPKLCPVPCGPVPIPVRAHLREPGLTAAGAIRKYSVTQHRPAQASQDQPRQEARDYASVREETHAQRVDLHSQPPARGHVDFPQQSFHAVAVQPTPWTAEMPVTFGDQMSKPSTP